MTTQYRKLAGIVTSHRASPAPGIVVQRPFPGPEIDQVSPFIMLDHFGPIRIAGSKP
jgi:redox-sensitive bicupin YhaK (pirin superfamily)